MSFERARVAEVWASRGNHGEVGSGYLISDRHVLTADHVLEPALHNGPRTCEVRCLGDQDWSSARIVWRDATLDLALVELAEQRQKRVAPVRWGRILGNQPVDCTAVGFPDAQARPNSTREPEQVIGRIPPLTESKANRLAVHVRGSAPSALTTGKTPWSGMSGAGVFVGSVLVGVVVVDPANFGTDRLTATPVSLLAQVSGLADVLQDAGVEPSLDPVPQFEGVELPRKQRLPPPGRRSPSMLLRSEFAVVPFRGRQAELASWVGWCVEDTDAPFVRLLFASAGVGKTRFATELVRRLDTENWFTGFVTDQAADTLIAEVAALGAPSLLVVDYAETRRNLAAMLAPLARRDPREIPIRVLLLARGAGDWWQQLQQASAELEFLIAGNAPHQLGPVDPAVSDRAAAFDEAARAFAAAQGLEFKPLTMPDPSRPDYESILFVHMAALDAVGTPEEQGPGAGARADLPVLSAIRARETRYWQRTAQAKGVLDDPHVLERVVLLATLIGAEDREDGAEELLRRVPDLKPDANEMQRRALARWCHDLEPYGSEWLPQLKPDALAEELTAHVLTKSPQLARTAFRELPYNRATRALTILDRAARQRADLEPLLADVLDADPTRLAPSAIAVAIQSGDPIGGLLARVLEQRADATRSLHEFHRQIPHQTVALREVAVILTAAAIEPALRTGSQSLAGVLMDLSTRLSELGQREAALPPIQEAVAIYRQLAAADADTFRPALARSLNNLSNRLADLGQLKAALTSVQEAVAINRELGTSRPETFRPELAGNLTNLSNHLSELGQREAALPPIQEAVAIYGELAAEHGDAFRPDLASSLSNLSNRLSEVGQREAALPPVQESVAIYRELEAAHSDAFRPGLAKSLTNLSNRLSDVDQLGAALTVIEEAVEIRRELVATRPTAFRPDLASSLNDLSNRLSELGQREAALPPIQEAVAIYRELIATRPDAFSLGLADCLNDESIALSELGRREEALTAIQEAVAIYRKLAEEDADSFSSDLAMSVINQSDRGDLGQRDASLLPIQEAVAIYPELTATRPDVFRTRLADSLNNASNVLSELGRGQEALAAMQEAVAIYRRLAEVRADAFRADLARAVINLAHRLSNLGQSHEALTAMEEAVGVYRQLATVRPRRYRTDLVETLLTLSRLLKHLGYDRESRDALDEANKLLAEEGMT